MNSHLGRFLVQADELLQECRGFGESLRTSLEAELERLSDTVAHTLDSAAQRTAEQAGARFGAQLEAALGTRLLELRQKLEDMSRLADRAAAGVDGALPAGLPVTGTAVAAPGRRAARPVWPRGLTVLVATANLMLAALLGLMLLDLRGEDRSAQALAPDAGVATAAGDEGAGQGASTAAPAWAELCEPLAASPDPAKAHALIAAAAAAACGDRAGAVTTHALAGVRALPAAEDAPEAAPEEKPSRGSRSPSRSRPREQKP